MGEFDFDRLVLAPDLWKEGSQDDRSDAGPRDLEQTEHAPLDGVAAAASAPKDPDSSTGPRRLAEHRPEQPVLIIQNRITSAMVERRDYIEDLTAMEAAMAEGDRMRSESSLAQQ